MITLKPLCNNVQSLYRCDVYEDGFVCARMRVVYTYVMCSLILRQVAKDRKGTTFKPAVNLHEYGFLLHVTSIRITSL